MGLLNLHGDYEKVLLEKKMICNSYQRKKSSNRDHYSPFPVIFQTISKFVIASVRLMLAKVWIDVVTAPRRKIDVGYEFDLKVILKGLGRKWRFL